MQPKISVIIPIFNVEKYLEDCLESVINQSLKEIEIICVDDGSTDGSNKILRYYASKDSRIHIIEKENGGLSSARNVGIEAAKGEYIHFLDSDDLMETIAYEYLYEKAKELKLDLLYFEAESFFENDGIKEKNIDKMTLYDRKHKYGVKKGIDLFTELKSNNDYIVSACLYLISLNLLREIRFSEGVYYEDNLFTFMTILRAKRATCIENKFYLRRVREGSITTSNVTAKHCLSRLDCFKNIFLESIRYEYTSEQFIQINDLIKTLRWHAVETYKKLDDYNRKIYLNYVDLPEKKLWHEFVIADEINQRKKQDDINKLKGELKNLQEEYFRIGHCISYKIGRLITYFPRKLRAFFKKTKGFYRPNISIKDCLADTKAKSSIGRPHISVIMPVYNSERCIERAINSLTNQTMKHIEIICVNDGSTDSSLELLNKLASKDRRIRVISQDNKGAAEARNKGIEVARGEYLLFLDSDDFFYPELCFKTYVQAKRDKAEVCLFSARRRNVETGGLEDMGWVLKTKLLPDKKPFSSIDAKDNLYRITTACPWTKLYKSKFVKRSGIRYQNLSNSNDVYFNRMLLSLAKRITYINDPFVEYSYNDSLSTQGTKDKAPTCFITAFERLKQELEKRNIFDLFEKAFDDMVKAETEFNYYSLKDENAMKKCVNALDNCSFKYLFEHDIKFTNYLN